MFHSLYGQCFTFDLSTIKKFRFVPYEGETRPYIRFRLHNNNPWNLIVVLLHTNIDLPDSDTYNGKTFITTTNSKELHKIEIRKKISTRESTRNMPCTHYEKKTCENIENNKLALYKFNCQIPMLYQGQHLNGLIPKNISICDDKTMGEVFKLISTKSSKCTQEKTCKMTRYTSVYKQQKEWRFSQEEQAILILFDSPEVEHYRTYISYDFLSLIGEVGGILGLTLGASALSLTEAVLQYAPYS